MKNNRRDKVFMCPTCNNKTLTPLSYDEIVGIGHNEIAICNECGIELRAITNYDCTVDFVNNYNK